jgi:hypothetical protein
MLNFYYLSNKKTLLITLLVSFCLTQTIAQIHLNKIITLNIKQQSLSTVVKDISDKGGFNFSYDGNIIAKDSLVSISAVNISVTAILHQLFNDKYEYQEQKNYVIITLSKRTLTLLNTDWVTDRTTTSISGIVVDEQSGSRLMNVSVYEKHALVATLTDEHGHFSLKLNTGSPEKVALTASKINYRDTTIHFLQAVNVTSRMNSNFYKKNPDQHLGVERTGAGKLLISSRQSIQSLNIPNFFATRPFQISLTPGLSTHGMFSPQVVNKFSLNLIGGYTAGVNGLEVGGLFNINKRESKYIQLAGVFNLAGGNVTGLQLAGLHNRSLDTVRGVQVSIFSNKAEQQLSGVQIGVMHNETHLLKGVQIGIINVADTSKGVSLGLVNIIRNGFYSVKLSANNLANTNISLKTGTHDFYTNLLTGVNISRENKLYSFGLGIGHDFMLSQRIFISAETDFQFVNTSVWDDRWTQGKLLLNVQLTKNISLIAGPSFNHYKHSGQWHVPGYKNVTDIPEYPDRFNPYQAKNWIGWEAGITFNSVFKPAKKTIDISSAWYLGAAVTGGIGWLQPFPLVSGIELFLNRDLGEHLTGTFTAGYNVMSVERVDLSTQDTYFRPFIVIPVKAGIRLNTGKHFFIAGDIGEAFGNTQPYYQSYSYPYRSFTYSASAGFDFKTGLELGLKYEDYGLQSNNKQFALRLGYRLKLSK